MGKGIDRDSPIPYYYQLRAILQDQIGAGQFRVGAQLPSEPSLCDQFGVSRTVVRQALGDLESEGLIERMKGKGTFVAAPKMLEHLAESLTGLHDDVTARGQRLRSRVLALEAVEPPADVLRLLGLSIGDQVVMLERLRFVDNEPWVFTRSYLPYALCAAILDMDMTTKSLYATLEGELGLTLARATRTVEAAAAGSELAGHLGIRTRSPVLLLKSLTFNPSGLPVEYFVAWHRGDRSRFEVQLRRQEIHRSVNHPGSQGIQLQALDAQPALALPSTKSPNVT